MCPASLALDTTASCPTPSARRYGRRWITSALYCTLRDLRSRWSLKPARLDNGVSIMVPQFIKTGDVIRLDVQNLKYMDRVKGAGK
jgi:hypothetical protein